MSELSEKEKLKRLRDEEARQLALKQVQDYLETSSDIFFVTKDAKFWKYVEDSQEWVFNSPDALKQSDKRLRGPQNWEQFLQVMQAGGRVKETKTYSFNKTPSSVLNMMQPAEWLEPKDGDLHQFFNYMMTAISGGKEENALHIKQCLGWKYLYPQTWQLPALAWYGKGGAGKNLFVEKVLGTIFGGTSIAKRSFEQVKKFAESIAGKTVVFFDERPSRDDESALKFFVGQPTLSIEPKGHAVYDCENTGWYIIATNGEEGPVRIEKNGTERRWSILKTTETLVDVVMRSEGVDEATARSMVVAADKDVFSNPDEIAKFLYTCVAEAKKLGTFPHALHGEDFDELIDTQQGADEDILHDVFVSYKDFEGITLQTLYGMYVERQEESNPGAKPLSSNRFAGRIMSYLVNNKIKHIKRSSTRVNAVVNKQAKKAWVFYNSDKMKDPKSFMENSGVYLTGAFVSMKPKMTMVTSNVLQMQ